VVGRIDPRVTALVGAAAVLVVALGGCARLGTGEQIGGIKDVAAQQNLAQGMADAFHPNLTVSPQNGAAGVSPTELVTAVVASGQLTSADLRSQDGGKLDGALSPDGARWTSTAPLKPNTSYVLTTVVRGTTGQESNTTTKFTTLSPGQQVGGKMTPADGGTVNPASPVSVLFDKPIVDRAAVEKALVVTSTPPIQGATHWRSDREVVWQPSGLWQPGSQATATLDFFGKQVGPGLFGGGDLRSSFKVGDLSTAVPQDNLDADLPPGTTPGAPVDPALSDPSFTGGTSPGLAGAPGVGAPAAGAPAAGAPGGVGASPPVAAAPPAARSNRTSPAAGTGAASPDAASSDAASPDAVVPDTTPDSGSSSDDLGSDDSPPPTTKHKSPPATRRPVAPQLPAL
jgi:hypothetical protein